MLAYVYYIIMYFFPGFNFDLLSTSKEIGWEDNPRNELFCQAGH